jgi:hypothetical protein
MTTEEALQDWEEACTAAHGGAAFTSPGLTAARLIAAGDKLKELIRSYQLMDTRVLPSQAVYTAGDVSLSRSARTSGGAES